MSCEPKPTWPLVLAVAITADDIRNGLPKECGKCPIAWASRRAFLAHDIVIQTISVSADKVLVRVHDADRSVAAYSLPRQATTWIMNFDEGFGVGPESFHAPLQLCYSQAAVFAAADVGS